MLCKKKKSKEKAIKKLHTKIAIQNFISLHIKKIFFSNIKNRNNN